MKERDFLKVISETLDCNDFIGDDCAFLSEFNLFVTQDTLVEDIHFKSSLISPYLLGRKTISVNLSDLAAALAIPKYVSVSLSLPNNIQNDYIAELYRGINDVCREFNVKVIGGDITGSDKIMLSVCAFGKKNSDFLTSRSFAKCGDYIITTGNYGASSLGFYLLSQFLYCDDFLKNSHLNPTPRLNEAKILAESVSSNIAVMDTSDGLVDAIYKIAQNSKHSLQIDFNSVSVDEKTKFYAKHNNVDYKKFVLWGGEDYELIACVPESTYKKLDKNIFKCIGKVLNKDTNPIVIIKDDNSEIKITKDLFYKNSYNHFKG